jgi:hypothetical protein
LLVGNNLFTLDNRTVPIPDLPDGTKVTFTNPFDFYDIFTRVFKAIGNDNQLYCLDQNQQWVAHGEVSSTGFSPISDFNIVDFLYLNTAEDGSVYFLSSKSSTGNADPAIWKTTFKDEFRYSVTKVCSLEDYDYENYDYTIVTRGSCMYYYGKNGGIYKADELAGTVKQLTFPNYSVRSLSEDGLGNIVVKGYDASLQPFTGYLDGNDQITFDVQAPDYQMILVSPINR